MRAHLLAENSGEIAFTAREEEKNNNKKVNLILYSYSYSSPTKKTHWLDGRVSVFASLLASAILWLMFALQMLVIGIFFWFYIIHIL